MKHSCVPCELTFKFHLDDVDDVLRGKRKVVQTELRPEDYESLRSLARKKNLTIKEAARDAVLMWNASVSDLSEDSLFRLKPVEFKVKVKADEIEAFLYKRR